MSRAIVLVFLPLSLLGPVIADDRRGKDQSDVRVSVSPKNFALYSDSSHPASSTGVVADSLEAAERSQHVHQGTASSAESAGAAQRVAKAATGMAAVLEDSRALRKAVASLGLDLESHNGDLGAEAHAEHALSAKAKFDKFAHAQFKESEQQLQDAHARLAEKSGSNSSPKTEDEQFADLEEESMHIMSMLNELKKLKTEKDRAAKEAKAAQRDPVGNLLATSAIEMAQILGAAGHVADGMSAFTAWKDKQDSSAESLEHGAQVKAKLSMAVKQLEAHEKLVTERSKQLKVLMDDATK